MAMKSMNDRAIYPMEYAHYHYSNVIKFVMASHITILTIVYSTIYTGADQWNYQRSASLAFVWGIHRWSVNSPHKWPVMLENDSIWLLFCLYQLFVVDSRDVFSIFFMAGSLAEHLRVGEATLKDIGENDSYLAKNHTQARTILRRVLCLELMGCSLLNLNPLLLNNI